MREIVVISWTATAACRATCAVAKTVARAGARLGIIGTAGHGRYRLCVSSRRTRIGASCATGSGTMSAVRLHVQSAGVADGASVGCPSPKGCGADTTIGASQPRIMSRRRRAGTIMFEGVTWQVLRTCSARRLSGEMRPRLFTVGARTRSVDVVGSLGGSRRRCLRLPIVHGS